MKKIRILITMLVIAIASVGVCVKAETSQSCIDKYYWMNGDFGFYFGGYIGQNLHIEMLLKVDGGTVYGMYRYLNSGSGDWIGLKGYYDRYTFTLTEYNSAGRSTGQFTNLTFIDSETWTGKFRNSKGKVYNVTLTDYSDFEPY